MKRATKLLAMLALCLCMVETACAQRTLSGMRGIQLTGGTVDGFYSPSTHNEAGYCLGAAMATYLKGGNKWVFGGEYLQKPYSLEQFTAEGGYYFRILSDPSKTLFLSLGGSAVAGYEAVNRGGKRLLDNSMPTNKEGFIYGGAVTLELETYLTDRIVLLVTGRERALWGNDTGRFHAQAAAGIKLIIN
jgi:hypothetical protein